MHSRMQSVKEKSPGYKKASYAIKFLLSAALLYFIFRQIDFQAAIRQAGKLPASSAALIMLLSLVRHFVQINNWRFALHMNTAYEYRAKEVLASYMVALPLRFALPGGHASFAKVFYLRNSSLLASLVSTTTERLFMTWSTWTFAAMAAYFVFPDLAPGIRIGMILFAAFMPFWALLIMAGNKKWRSYIPQYSRQAPRMMLLQIANTILMYAQYYLILNELGKLGAIETWLAMALTNISNSIPITISGLGLREGFAIHFLKSYGFGAEQAVAATLSLFFFHDVIPALAGAVVLLRAKRPARLTKP